MRHTQRAIHAVAVVGGCLQEVAMAWVAEVVIPAAKECLSAAEVALPSNVIVPVLLAVELPATYLFDLAGFAEQILLARRLGQGHLALTFGQTSVKRHFAGVALVKGAFGQKVLVWLVVELGTFIIDRSHFNLAFGLELSCHVQDPLLEL